ncbi:sensor histidine kinase [Sphaerisporangium aureirubrum]|uniref:Sensor histidine kinase n=1 Tax=Sphaerisporangium aureirubrum TaxID=1544736 RepID=A0ABW1NDR2_9ACTN
MNMDQRLRAMGLWPFRRHKRSRSERVRRVTLWTLTGSVVMAWIGPAADILGSVGEDPTPTPVLLGGVAGLVVFSVLYVRAMLAAVAGRRAHVEVAAAALITVVLLLTQGGEAWTWGLLGPVWAAMAVLGVSASAGVLICVVATVASAALAVGGLPGLPELISLGSICAVIPWANRFQLWLWEIVREAEEGEQARARLAVTEERLRFARDLHDLVGHSLSAIAVKSEVATKLATTDGERAAAEMAEVRALARKSLHEMRGAVRGYRTVDLAAELHSVRAVLEASGIRCALDPVPDGLPQDVTTVLAWVVREGTTNVLRHSKAGECRIGLAVRDGRAVLEMTNDGAGGPSGADGSGLAGLAERVASLGGALTARPDGHRFTLSAAVPLRDAP